MSIRKRISAVLTLAIIAMVGASGKPAHASLAPDNPVVTASGADFTFSYATSLSSAEKIKAGDFLTIDDIQGYVTGSAFSNALFTPVVTTTGGLTDITWTATNNVNGPKTYNFGFKSSIDELGIGSYLFKDHSKTGVLLFGSGTVQVPTVTPEPSSGVFFGLCGLALLGFALFNRSRRAGTTLRVTESLA
jgi:hypothetical protein